MSLEKAMEKLADSYDRHTAMMEKHIELQERMLEQGVVLMAPAGATTTASAKPAAAAAEEAKTEKPTRGRNKPKAEPVKEAEEAEEEEAATTDEFADEFEEEEKSAKSKKELTADDIREMLMSVKEKKGADAARSILTAVGVKTIASIPEKDYDKVAKLCAKA